MTDYHRNYADQCDIRMKELELELASVREDRCRLDDANIDLNHELASTKKERDFFENAFRERHGQREELKKMLDEALIVTRKCADDYWFMIMLIEKYSSNKEAAMTDILERMKFRLPMFKALAKHEKKEEA